VEADLVAAGARSESSQAQVERLILRGIPMALIVMSTVGIVIALVSRHPGDSFEGLGFAFCVGTILFAALLYWGQRIATQSKFFVDISPRARYVPGSIFGVGYLLLLLLVFVVALIVGPGSYSGVDRVFLIWMVLILIMGASWVAVALRRSMLDGAWHRHLS
jgi:hypothetical protein